MDSKIFAGRAVQIEKQLRLAFPSNPVPTEHRREDGVVDWEVEEDLQRILGKAWPEVTLEDWTHMVNPAFIRGGTSTQFFKYYVPSILTCVLSAVERVDQLALSALLPNNPKREPRDEWRCDSRVRNDPQCRRDRCARRGHRILGQQLRRAGHECE